MFAFQDAYDIGLLALGRYVRLYNGRGTTSHPRLQVEPSENVTGVASSSV